MSVFVESIIAFDLGRKSSAVSWDESIDRSKVLTTLIEIAIVIGKDKALKRFIAHALATCKHYDLTDVHLKTIFALEKTLQSISAKSTTKTIGGWLKSCKSELERRTSLAPQPPADLRRAGTMDCNCADCKQVAAFLKTDIERDGSGTAIQLNLSLKSDALKEALKTWKEANTK